MGAMDDTDEHEIRMTGNKVLQKTAGTGIKNMMRKICLAHRLSLSLQGWKNTFIRT